MTRWCVTKYEAEAKARVPVGEPIGGFNLGSEFRSADIQVLQVVEVVSTPIHFYFYCVFSDIFSQSH